MEASVLAKVLAWGSAVVFLGYGIGFTLAPAEMIQLITGDNPRTSSALIDMRATYGGMSLAIGILLVLLMRRSVGGVSDALLLTALVLLCMAITRVFGIVIDGSPNITMLVYLVLEIVVAVIALFLHSGLRK